MCKVSHTVPHIALGAKIMTKFLNPHIPFKIFFIDALPSGFGKTHTMDKFPFVTRDSLI